MKSTKVFKKTRHRTNSDKGSKRTDRKIKDFVQKRHQVKVIEGSLGSSFEQAETPTIHSKLAASEQDKKYIQRVLLENAQLKCQVKELQDREKHHVKELALLYESLQTAKTQLKHTHESPRQRACHKPTEVHSCIDKLQQTLPSVPWIQNIVYRRIGTMRDFAQKSMKTGTSHECLAQALEVLFDIVKKQSSGLEYKTPLTERKVTYKYDEESLDEKFDLLKQRINKVQASFQCQVRTPRSRNN